MNSTNYPKKREHSYNSYISSIDWTERIIREGVQKNSEKWLLNDVAKYLKHENSDFAKSNPNNDAMWKALELMEGYERDIPQSVMKKKPVVYKKSEQQRKIVFKKIVKAAFQKGYLENFRLAEPWHPSSFLSRDFVSYPYQHNTAIVYRGISRDNYYTADEKPRKPGGSTRNPISILNQGYLNPGNSFNDDNDDAVWTTPFLDTARGYGTRSVDNNLGIVLEIQAPTKLIQCGAHGVRETSNLEEMKKEFGSPENYREHVKNSTSENVSFLLRPKLPIKYVTGVWDLQFFDEPYFVPLQRKNTIDAIDLAHKYQENKVPGNPKYGSVGFEDKTGDFIEIRNLTERLKKDSTKLERICKSTIESIKDLNLGRERRIQGESSYSGYNIESLTETIIKNIENLEGDGSNSFNYTVKSIIDDLKEIGIEVEPRRVEANNITELHKEIAHNYKGARKLEEECEKLEVSLEDSRVDDKRIENIESIIEKLVIIKPDKSKIIESVEGSTADARQEVLKVEHDLEHTLKIAKWIEKIDKKLKEAVKTIEIIKKHGVMNSDELSKLYAALNSYENIHPKEYGYNELLDLGKSKLGVPKDGHPRNNSKKHKKLTVLEKQCIVRERKLSEYKEEVKKAEKELEAMIKECEKLKEESFSAEEIGKVKEEVSKMKEKNEELRSENSVLYKVFAELEGVSFDYRKFESKVGQKLTA